MEYFKTLICMAKFCFEFFLLFFIDLRQEVGAHDPL